MRLWAGNLNVWMQSYIPLTMSARAIPFATLSSETSAGESAKGVSETQASTDSAQSAIRTLVRRRKLGIHHDVDYLFHISRQGVARAIVHCRLVDAVVGGMTCLKDIEGAAHVALGQLDERLLAVPGYVAPAIAPPGSATIERLSGCLSHTHLSLSMT